MFIQFKNPTNVHDIFLNTENDQVKASKTKSTWENHQLYYRSIVF